MKNVIISVAGITEHTAYACGDEIRERHPLSTPYAIETIPQLFAYPVKHLGRFPRHVRAACGACALCFKLAGIPYAKDRKQEIALLAAGYEPTLGSNRVFFRDYLASGRTTGRGNLFIYTLPTSALAEVSIHFGLTGPSVYIEAGNAPFESLLEASAEMMQGESCRRSVIIWQDAECTLCFVTGRQTPGVSHMARYEDMLRLAAGWRKPEDVLRSLEFSDPGR